MIKAKSLNSLCAPASSPEILLIAAVLGRAARDALNARRLAVGVPKHTVSSMTRFRHRTFFEAIDFLKDPKTHELADALGVDLAGWIKEQGI